GIDDPATRRGRVGAHGYVNERRRARSAENAAGSLRCCVATYGRVGQRQCVIAAAGGDACRRRGRVAADGAARQRRRAREVGESTALLAGGIAAQRRVCERNRIGPTTTVEAGAQLGRVTADRAACERARSVAVVDSTAVARALVAVHR